MERAEERWARKSSSTERRGAEKAEHPLRKKMRKVYDDDYADVRADPRVAHSYCTPSGAQQREVKKA